MGHHAASILELHPIQRVWQRLDNLGPAPHRFLPLEWFFHGWVRIQGPLEVTATQCSKCAARLPSLVTAVQ